MRLLGRTDSPRLLCICVAFVALAGCGRVLDLPAAPGSRPEVTSVEPLTGYAGRSVIVRGTHLRDATGLPEVRFGAGGTARALGVATDGTSLEVLVPDDAQTGTIEVATADGRGASASTFTYRGLGRLRTGRAVASTDLRRNIEVAFPIGNGELLALVRQAQALVHVKPPDTTQTVLDKSAELLETGVRAITLSADGLRFAIVTNNGGGDCDVSVRLRTLAAPAIDEAVACLPDAVAEEGHAFRTGPYVELSRDGGKAVIGITQIGRTSCTYTVDFASGHVSRHETLTSSAVGFLDDATAFTADENTIELLQFTTATAKSEIAYPPARNVRYVAAAGPYLAVAVCEGTLPGDLCADPKRVELRDRTSPATTLGTISLLDLARIDSLTFSPDGTRLVAVQQTAGRVLLFDTSTADATLLARRDFDAPRTVTWADRAFFVAHRGGASELSAATGEVVDAAKVRSGLAFPRFRSVECVDDLGVANGERTLLEIPMRAVGGYERVNPGDFTIDARCRGSSFVTSEAIRGFEAQPDRSAGYILLGDGSLVQAERSARGTAFPATHTAGAPYALGVPGLALSPDGNMVAAIFGGVPRAKVLVFDASTPWRAGLTPPKLEVTVKSLAAGIAFTNRALVVAGRSLKFLDRADALAGKETALAPERDSGSTLKSVSVADDTVFVVADLPGQELLAYLPTGDIVTGAMPAFAAYASVIPAPGARMVYGLIRETGFSSLVSHTFDPSSGAVGPQTLVATMPKDASELLFMPDGERLIVIDPVADRVHLFE